VKLIEHTLVILFFQFLSVHRTSVVLKKRSEIIVLKIRYKLSVVDSKVYRTSDCLFISLTN
jgi:hypothetical protein